MKKYINVKENTHHITHLKIEVYYSLGGYNYFTYKQENRGYYLSVSPVERKTDEYGTMESYTAFTGIKKLIKEVSRKSKKAEAEAEAIAENETKNLIDYVCTKNNLEVTQ